MDLAETERKARNTAQKTRDMLPWALPWLVSAATKNAIRDEVEPRHSYSALGMTYRQENGIWQFSWDAFGGYSLVRMGLSSRWNLYEVDKDLFQKILGDRYETKWGIGHNNLHIRGAWDEVRSVRPASAERLYADADLHMYTDRRTPYLAFKGSCHPRLTHELMFSLETLIAKL
ncbi:MAG: hypothetical protein HGA85_06750 [Nanoarchaeota archaeon]|nr:hypothetical protein [Nanoarchaeota archaeon]